MFPGGGRGYNSGMAIATCLPNAEVFAHADPFSAAVAQDTLALASELADALQILIQCQARNVVPADDFLNYVDGLTEQIECLQPGRTVHSA